MQKFSQCHVAKIQTQVAGVTLLSHPA